MEKSIYPFKKVYKISFGSMTLPGRALPDWWFDADPILEKMHDEKNHFDFNNPEYKWVANHLISYDLDTTDAATVNISDFDTQEDTIVETIWEIPFNAYEDYFSDFLPLGSKEKDNVGIIYNIKYYNGEITYRTLNTYSTSNHIFTTLLKYYTKEEMPNYIAIGFPDPFYDKEKMIKTKEVNHR